MNIQLLKQGGFTLVELLIVVAIIGILMGVAYPSYKNHITKTRYADAKVKLLEIMQKQRSYFTESNKYTTNLTTDLGYVDAGSGAVASDNEFYNITAMQCGALALTKCVLLTASANFTNSDTTSITLNSKNIKTGPERAW